MVTLLGNEVAKTGAASETTTAGKLKAWKFIASRTDILETLEVFTSTNVPSATSVVLGVYAERSGKPGTVLGQGTFIGKPAASTWFAVTGLSVPITSGNSYWLAMIPVGGELGLLYEAAGSMVRATGTHTKLEEASWENFGVHEPTGFRGLGPELYEGSLFGSVEFLGVVKGAKVANAALAQIDGLQQGVTGSKAASCLLTQHTAVTTVLAGKKIGVGHITLAFGDSGTIIGSKIANGKIIFDGATSVGMIDGQKIALARSTQAFGLTPRVGGGKSTTGALACAISLTVIAAGRVVVSVHPPSFANIVDPTARATITPYESGMSFVTPTSRTAIADYGSSASLTAYASMVSIAVYASDAETESYACAAAWVNYD
jgi:hypothetical protein